MEAFRHHAGKLQKRGIDRKIKEPGLQPVGKSTSILKIIIITIYKPPFLWYSKNRNRKTITINSINERLE
ncbi:hypothetical protein A7X67_11640 [Clostridium sp. W14A]|nr:hypothetical protein A7X67_11640 [Clostridium sp. W14A]